MSGMKAVKSKAIRRIAYNAKKQILIIEFRGSAIYGYLGITDEVAERFRQAVSKGRFFATRIKHRFQEIKIEARSELAGYLDENGDDVPELIEATEVMIRRCRALPDAVMF